MQFVGDCRLETFRTAERCLNPKCCEGEECGSLSAWIEQDLISVMGVLGLSCLGQAFFL